MFLNNILLIHGTFRGTNNYCTSDLNFENPDSASPISSLWKVLYIPESLTDCIITDDINKIKVVSIMLST